MFEFREIDRSPGGLREVAGFLRQVWPNADHLTPGFLEWQYNGNPIAPAFGCNGFSGTAMVAHFVLHPVRVWLQGGEQLGLIAFNLSTHPDHRGKGLFREVAERTFEAARSAGYDFFYGVTNAMSTPVFERWGFQVVCPLEVKVGFGPTPPRRDQGSREFLRIWDPPTLAWRLRDPQRRFSTKRRREGTTVFAETGRFGIRAEMGTYANADLPPDLPALRALPPLRMWMGVDASRNWRGHAYLDLPRRVRPVPLILMFGDLSGKGRRVDPSRVRFDALDFDAF